MEVVHLYSGLAMAQAVKECHGLGNVYTGLLLGNLLLHYHQYTSIGGDSGVFTIMSFKLAQSKS